MNMDWLNSATQREIDQFRSVCNQLLSRTYVVRTLYKPGKGRVTNPDYTFLSIHFEDISNYLSLRRIHLVWFFGIILGAT